MKKDDARRSRNASHARRKNAKLDEFFRESPTTRGDVPTPLSGSLRSIATRDEVLTEELEEALGAHLIRRIITDVGQVFTILQTLENALERNPRDLFVDYVRQLVNSYNNLCKSIKREVSGPYIARLQDSASKLREYLRSALAVFGVPYLIKQTCDDDDVGEKSVFVVCISPNGAVLNEEKLRFVAERRIISPCGKLICEILPKVRLRESLGVDSASYEWILNPWGLRYSYELFFAVATSVRAGNGGSDVTIYPRPETLREYFARGGLTYVIPSVELSRYPEYYQKRIHEAVLNEVEYDAAAEVSHVKLLRNDAIIFLDGRVLPYEHRFDDVLADHGPYVIRALRNYISLLDVARRVSVVGIVKRRGVSVLWHLLRHVALPPLTKGGGPHLLEEPTIEMARDGFIAPLLFYFYEKRAESSEARGGDSFLITYIVVRPFWALDPNFWSILQQYLQSKEGLGWRDVYNNEEKEEFWRGVLYEYLQRAGDQLASLKMNLEDALGERYRNMDEVAHKAAEVLAPAVASRAALFFTATRQLLREHLWPYLEEVRKNPIHNMPILELPRWEVLIPGIGRNERFDSYEQYILSYVSSALMSPSKTEELFTPYPHLGKYAEQRNVVYFTPVSVFISHEYASGSVINISKIVESAIQRDAIEALGKLFALIRGGEMTKIVDKLHKTLGVNYEEELRKYLKAVADILRDLSRTK